MPPKRPKAQTRKGRILHLDVDDLAGNEKPHAQEGRQIPEESRRGFALWRDECEQPRNEHRVKRRSWRQQ